MHKYYRHIGDYAKDTRHLTLLEHGAYSMLLDLAYSTEKPLPADLSAVCRLCCARSKDEQRAVENVVAEFFTQSEAGGWIQKRVLNELADYAGKSDKARYAIFCRVWKKDVGKKRAAPSDDLWLSHLAAFYDAHPTITRESSDYQTMVEWYSNVIPTSTQEPVPKNQEPVFPADYPPGHAAALAPWWDYKRERRETYKPTGWATLLQQQAKFTAEQVEASVEASIASNYAGLFTEKIAQRDSRGSPEKKERAAGEIGGEVVHVAAPKGWELAMDACFGADWREFYGAFETLRHADQRQVRAWLSKNTGGANS